MASVAGGSPHAALLNHSGAAAFIDRWIYVFMAGLFVATTLVGFIPDSISKLAAIQAGARAPFPPVLHVHAAIMGTWLLLLLMQTVLMATGRKGLHMQLGMAATVIAPAMVLTGFFLVPTMFGQNWAGMQSPPPGVPAAEIEIGKKFISSLVAGQIAAGVMFAIFVSLALRARKSDPETHKRLMILATVVPLPAAIDRIGWLPSTYPDSVLSPMLYTVLWITPMLIWDLARHQRLLRAYVIWFAVFIPTATLVINLWWSDWWIATAQRLMGVS